MGIDASIPLGVRPPQIENPMNSLARVMQVQGLQQQNALGQLQMDKYKRDVEDQEELRGELSAPNVDTYQVLLRRGRVKDAGDFQKSQNEAAKFKTDQKAKELEMAGKRLEIAGQAFGHVRQNPTLENAHMALDYLKAQGVYEPAVIEEWKALVAQDPSKIGALADQAFRAALGAKEQLMKITTSNTGGRTVTQGADPVSGKVTMLGEVQNTQSPDNAASNARMAADAAASRGVQIRGQDLTNRRALDRLDFERGTAVADAGGPSQVALVKQFGKPPKDHRWKPDGSAEPIPGGPADTKVGAEAENKADRAKAFSSEAELVIKTIDDALDKIGYGQTGLIGSISGSIPGTKAYDLRRAVDTIKANIGFGALQRMREMSPTGGALGQVAVQELNMLQATLGNLDANQSEPEVRKRLEQVKVHYKNWKNVMRQSAGLPADNVVDLDSLPSARKPAAGKPDAKQPPRELKWR